MMIFHVSDTHQFHDQIIIPDGIDIMIHSGDCSNSKSKFINSNEVLDFIDWYSQVKCNYRIYVAGNHDGSIEAKMFTKKMFAERGIIYLENDSVEIEGFKIHGSPYSPSFCEWYFMKKRDKLHEVWQLIPDDTDILITHTPPKGMLDLSEDRDRNIDFCGCNALLKRVLNLNLKAHFFGHIHNGHGIVNTGIRKYDRCQTIFSNASAVEDAKFDKGIVFNGNIITL